MIFPFTKENIDFLTKNEKKKIVKMNITDAIIDLMIKIYDKVENKNFFKSNKSVNDISYLNEKCKFSVCGEKEFTKQLFLNCLYIYLRVVYEYKEKYKNEISFDELLNIVKQYFDLKNSINDINTVSESVENTNYLHNKIKNFCKTYIENENIISRDTNIELRKSALDDKSVLTYFENMYKVTSAKIAELELDLQPDIDDEDFIKHLGEMIEYNIEDDNTKLELKTKRFEDSDIKKYYDDRNQAEINFVKQNPKLGSIKYLSERLENINKKKEKLEKLSNSIEN
jgi:hypothetical protein